jgi:hypothetical protein
MLRFSFYEDDVFHRCVSQLMDISTSKTANRKLCCHKFFNMIAGTEGKTRDKTTASSLRIQMSLSGLACVSSPRSTSSETSQPSHLNWFVTSFFSLASKFLAASSCKWMSLSWVALELFFHSLQHLRWNNNRINHENYTLMSVNFSCLCCNWSTFSPPFICCLWRWLTSPTERVQRKAFLRTHFFCSADARRFHGWKNILFLWVGKFHKDKGWCMDDVASCQSFQLEDTMLQTFDQLRSESKNNYDLSIKWNFHASSAEKNLSWKLFLHHTQLTMNETKTEDETWWVTCARLRGLNWRGRFIEETTTTKSNCN